MRDGGDRGRWRMRMRGARGRPAAAARTEVDAPFGHAVGAGALRPALRNEERTDVTRVTAHAEGGVVSVCQATG